MADETAAMDDIEIVGEDSDLLVEGDETDDLILDLDISGPEEDVLVGPEFDADLELGREDDSEENEWAENVDEELESNVGEVAINATNFPSEDFRLYVQAYFDQNGDKKLSQSETNAVKEIEISYTDCTSLKGIEFFPNLYSLICDHCKIKYLNVSKNKNLSSLSCEGNLLKNIDVSKNTKLEYFYCGENKLTSLNVNNNPKISWLGCEGNKLTKIDVSRNTELYVFRCNDNLLTTLDLSKNTILYTLNAKNNRLTKLNLNKNTKLEELYIYNNKIKNLDIENCAMLQLRMKNPVDEEGHIEYRIDDSTYISIDYETTVTAGNKVLHKGEIPINSTTFPDTAFEGYVYYHFDRDNNGYLSETECKAVKKIDIQNGVPYDVAYYSGDDDDYDDDYDDYYDDEDDNIPVKNLKGIELFQNLKTLSCRKNRLSALNLGKNPKLSYLDCRDNRLTKLIISDNEKLAKLYCDGNRLSTLDLTGNPNLINLFCANNKLTALNLAKNTALVQIDCSGNQMKKLALAQNTKLQELACSNNALSTLDVSKLKKLTMLNCSNNKITSLNVKKNEKLKKLYCEGNEVTKLTMGKHASLEMLHAQDNKLTFVDIGKCPKIKTLLEKKASIDDGHINWSKGALSIDASTKLISGKSILYPPKNAIAVSAKYFPDSQFRSYVLNTIDTNGDAYLTTAECKAVKAIDVSYMNISNLKGLGCFPNLSELECYANRLKNLDVRKNLKLTWLNCSDNSLTSLNVSKNTELTRLDCSDNRLTSLNVSKNTEISKLFCENNRLKSLNVSNNTKLKTLWCDRNPIGTYDVSKLPAGLKKFAINNSWKEDYDYDDDYDEYEYIYCSNSTYEIRFPIDVTLYNGNEVIYPVDEDED